MVYDRETGKPLPMATVSIYNEEGKKADSRVTDSMGTYGFLVPPGKYSIIVEKKGYIFTPYDEEHKVFYVNNYEGQVLDVQEYDLIKKDIPLKPEKKTWASWFDSHRVARGTTFVVFYGGFAFSLFALYVSPGILNSVVCGLYVICAVFNAFAGKGVRWGRVVGKHEEKKGFAYIKVFDKKDESKMVARTISDEQGRYYLILEKGDYNLEAVGTAGDRWHGELAVPERMAIKKKIVLDGKRQDG